MIYCVREVQSDQKLFKTAGTKARDDADAIFLREGAHPIEIPAPIERRGEKNPLKKMAGHVDAARRWREKLSILSPGDVLCVQFPVVEHSVFLYREFRRLKKKGVHIVLLIHDLELLRKGRGADVSVPKKIRVSFEETRILKNCSSIIAHNPSMIRYLSGIGIPEEKMVSLGLFDYLIPEYDAQWMEQREIRKDLPVIVAGNLRPHKAGYVYRLQGCGRFFLFGVGYEGKEEESIRYFGSFSPQELPYRLRGSFGLVWDGDDTKTCAGIFGEYLRINNPHKVSLYLASSIPVIVWKQSALAETLVRLRCAIAVDSLEEIGGAIAAMSEETYEEYRANAEKIGRKLRQGAQLKAALAACLSSVPS